ncbi:hypothetical protein, partial [Galactobacillus timonensis]|uniref:hypothetical protein n=1 Tax=Galactobacillus timonensis TaxID=2041840 RepID=UPI002409B466
EALHAFGSAFLQRVMLHLNLNIHLSRMTRMISSSLCQCGVTGGVSYEAYDPAWTRCMDEAAEFLEELNFDHSLTEWNLLLTLIRIMIDSAQERRFSDSFR